MTTRLIPANRSVVIAMDVPSHTEAITVARAVQGIEGISGFKYGIELGLSGLSRSVGYVNENSDPGKIHIYDHQKAGNDIPEMGAKFARALKNAGIHVAILFPFTGPKVQTEWTKVCRGEGLGVMVGGMMTHEQFLRSEGGYIDNDTPERIYKLAMELGVTSLVMPGNKLEWIEKITAWLDEGLGSGNYESNSPGFISQGGDVTAAGKLIKGPFHAIIGSAIYGKEQLATPEKMREVALACTSKLAA